MALTVKSRRAASDLRAPDVVAQHTAAGVHHVVFARQRGARGRSLPTCSAADGSSRRGRSRPPITLVLAATAEHHVHDAEAPADDEGAAEQAFTCSGVALVATSKSGAQAQQQVAHRAADDVGLVALFLGKVSTTRTARSSQAGVDAQLGGT